jgi:hypothetical protein
VLRCAAVEPYISAADLGKARSGVVCPRRVATCLRAALCGSPRWRADDER